MRKIHQPLAPQLLPSGSGARWVSGWRRPTWASPTPNGRNKPTGVVARKLTKK